MSFPKGNSLNLFGASSLWQCCQIMAPGNFFDRPRKWTFFVKFGKIFPTIHTCEGNLNSPRLMVQINFSPPWYGGGTHPWSRWWNMVWIVCRDAGFGKRVSFDDVDGNFHFRTCCDTGDLWEHRKFWNLKQTKNFLFGN